MTDRPAAAMTAMVQDAYGPPERVMHLEQVDRPPLGDDQVLVRVRAASVNTPDWIAAAGRPWFLRAIFGLVRPYPRIRGSDLSGVVEAVGPRVTDLRPGDEVFGSTRTGSRRDAGTFAEFAVAPRSQLLHKPAGLSFEDAAGSVMSGLTALSALVTVGAVGPGMKVLINGASGGIGVLAVQIARALGAEVTGVCSTQSLELVRSMGAHHLIDYTKEDFTRGEARYDVILDNVLNHPPGACLSVLTPNGAYLPNSVGQGQWIGGVLRMARGKLFGGKRVRLVPIQFDQASLTRLAEWLTSGRLQVIIERVYPLSEAGVAVAHMMAHHARGKLVIAV